MATTTLGVKTDGSEKVIVDWAKSFGLVNTNLEILSATQVRVGQTAKGAFGVLSGVINAVSKSGTQFAVTMREVDGEMKIVDLQAKQTAATIEKLQKSMAKRSASSEGDRFGKYAGDRVKTLDPSVLLNERAKLQRLMEQARRLIVNPENKLDVSAAINLGKLYRGGSKELFTGPMGELQKTIIQFEDELKRLRALPGKRLAEQTKLGDQKAAGKAIEDALRKHAKSLTGLSPSDRVNLDALTQSLAKLARTGKLTQDQFDKVWDHIVKGGKAKFSDLEEIGRVAGQRVVREFERLQDIMDKRQRAAAGRAAAPGVNPAIDKLIGSVPSALTSRQAAIIDQAKAKIKEFVESGQIEFGKFQKVITDVFAGKSISDLTMFERRVGVLAQSIALNLQKAREAVSREGKESEASLIAASQAALARQKMKEFFSKNSGYAGPRSSGLPAARNLDRLRPQFAEKIRRELAKVEGDIAKGRITLAQYQQGFETFATRSSASLTGGAERVRQAMANIGASIEGAQRKASVLQMTLDAGWKFVKSQIIIDSIGRMKDNFVSATQEAANLHRQVALIQTLSKDAGMTQAEWTRGLQQVSSETGFTIESVAKAAYDALSQQVVTGQDAFAFLREAAKFSVATDTSIEDSVTLLSRHVNTMGKDAEAAAGYAAKFFKMIDLGQVKGSELANTMGRVGGMMKSLGGDVDEASAILSVLTRSMTNFDEGSTLMINLLAGLNKPSKELTKEFLDMGYASSDAAVKAKGVIGIMEEIGKRNNFSPSKTAELFPEIRRERIALFTQDHLGEIKKDLAKLKDAKADYEHAVDTTTTSYGQRWKKELEEIANYWTTGWKTLMLRTVLDITDVLGGLSNVIKYLYIGVMSLGGAWATLKIWTTTTAAIQFIGRELMITTDLAFGLKYAFANIAPALNAGMIVASLAAIGYAIYDNHSKWNSFMDDVREDAAKVASVQKAALRKEVAGKKDQISENLTSVQKSAIDSAAAVNRKLNGMAEAGRNAAKEISRAMTNNLEEALQAAHRFVNDLESQLNHVVDMAKQAEKFNRDKSDDDSSRRFHRDLAINDINKRNAEKYAKYNAQGVPADIYAQRADKSEQLMKARVAELQKKSEAAAKTGNWEKASKFFPEINQLQDQIAALTKSVPINAVGPYGRRYRYSYSNYGPHDTGDRTEVLRDPTYRKKIDAESVRQQSIAEKVTGLSSGHAELLRTQIEIQRESLKRLEDVVDGVRHFNPYNEQGGLKDGVTAKSAQKDLDAAVGAATKGLRDYGQNTAAARNLLNPEDRARMHDENRRNFDDRARRAEELLPEYSKKQRGVLLPAQAKSDVQSRLDAALHQIERANQEAKESGEVVAQRGDSYIDTKGETDAKVRQVIAGATRNLKGRTALWRAIEDLGDGIFGISNPDLEEFENLPAALEKARSSGNYGPLKKSLDERQRALAAFNDHPSGIADAPGALTSPEKAELENLRAKSGAGQQLSPKDRQRFSGLKAQEASPTVPADQAVAMLRKQLELEEQRAKLAKQTDAGLNNLVDTPKLLKMSFERLPEEIGKLGPSLKSAASDFEGEFKKMLEQTNAEIRALDILNTSLSTAIERAKEVRGAVDGEQPSADSASTPAGRWMGGMVGYYHDGGFLSNFLSGSFARGRDTRPIMADPEEFIVNSESTRKFYPQLMALNGGIDPATLHGGTGNVHVGAINVSVQGGDSSAQTVGNIANGINRGIRRGQIRLGSN